MAGEIPPLNITVNLETSGVQTGVNQATTSIKGISAAAEATASKFTNLKSVMLGTFASSEIQKGIQAFEGFLKDSVKAAEGAQTSIAALGVAMNNAKQNTDANRQAVEKSTTSMEALGFKANDTREALTKMITATGSVTESQRLMGVAADYARLKHEDLTQAATILTRGTTGAARAFREFGIVLDTNLPKNQAITKAFDELNQKIGGQAAAYAETYAGKLAIMGAQSEDLKEKIGALLLPVLTKLESWFIESVKWLADHKAALEAVALVVGTLLLVAVTNLTISLVGMAAAWVTANLPMIAIIATIGLVVAGFVKLWNSSETFRKIVVDALKLVVDAFGYLVGAIGKVIEAASHLPFIGGAFKGMASAVNGAALDIGKFGDKLDSLSNKKIDIKFPNIADQLAKATGGTNGVSPDIAGLVPGGSTAKGAAAADKKMQADQAKLKTYIAQEQTILADRATKMAAAQATYDDAVTTAQTKHSQEVLDITSAYNDKMLANKTAYDDAVATATADNEQKIIDIQQQYADKAVALQQKAVDDQQKIIQQSIDVMTSGFASATKIDLGKLFTSGGSSAGGLVAGLQDQLAQITQLQQDAGKLAAQGYNQSFINEVIAQGPKQGDALAQSVLTAAPETQDSIKQLYAQVQDASQNGLNDLAKQMNDGTSFATQQLAQSYAQVSVDLQKALSDNSAALTDSLNKQQDAFQKQLDAAQVTLDKANKAAADARDLALQKSAQTLADSLQTAQDNYTKATNAISDATMKQLDALQTKITTVMALLASMGKMAGIGNGVTSVPAGSITSAPLTYTSSNGFNVPNATPQGPGIGSSAPIIGSLTQNVYTTDPSLPSITTGLTNAITVGQTQGLMSTPTMSTFQR